MARPGGTLSLSLSPCVCYRLNKTVLTGMTKGGRDLFFFSGAVGREGE